MRRFVNPGKRIASFTRTFARLRWALGFDGVGVRGVLTNRAINPDGDNTFEFYAPSIAGGLQSIIMQTVSISGSGREFGLYFDSNLNGGTLIMNFGGAFNGLCNASQGFEVGKKYFLSLVGNTFTLAKGVQSNVIRSGAITKGAVREPSVITYIGALPNGSGGFSSYFVGIQRDVKINGVRWPMADRNQAIQLPQPSGLGAELITQSVLENPVEVGNQWSYLGSGRWSYVGDGSLNTLKFILTENQPAQGFFEFEIESISGGGITCTDTVPSNSVFTTIGVKRFFYTNKADITSIAFKRAPAGTPVSCIVKNISFKPLGACNPMTISNATSTNWVQVVDDYVAKFRKVLRFDGVGVRGIFTNAIELTDANPVKGKFRTGSTLPANSYLFGPNEASAYNSRIRINSDGSVAVRPTINNTDVITCPAGTVKTDTTYSFELSKNGTLYTLKLNGVVVGSGSLTGGGALFKWVGATATGTTDVPIGFFLGFIYDFEAGGQRWPIADSTQSIQLPEPSGLGAELITPTVLENPFIKGSHWTYLGDGKWQYVGDGSANELRFLTSPQHPEQGFLEFEIESISGMITCTNASTARSRFNSTGVKRFFYTDFNETIPGGAAIIFKRTPSGQVASCIIKNISFKPLGTCNPLTLANVTSANWEDLEI